MCSLVSKTLLLFKFGPKLREKEQFLWGKVRQKWRDVGALWSNVMPAELASWPSLNFPPVTGSWLHRKRDVIVHDVISLTLLTWLPPLGYVTCCPPACSYQHLCSSWDRRTIIWRQISSLEKALVWGKNCMFLQTKYKFGKHSFHSLCLSLHLCIYTFKSPFQCYYGNWTEWDQSGSAKKFAGPYRYKLKAIWWVYTYMVKYPLKVRKPGFWGLHGNRFQFFWILVNRHPTSYVSWKFQVCSHDGYSVIMSRTYSRDGLVDLIIINIYFGVPARWALQQTTLGSGQRQDTGSGILWSIHRWTRPTGELIQNLKKKRTVHLTRFFIKGK